jgi:hypothetical protein
MLARRGAGSRPWRSRIVRTVVAETLIPSFSSSPADALVAPPRVLPSQAHDEVVNIGLDRWPAGMPTLLVCPLLLDEFPMPTQQGLRPHQERRPPVSGHRPARSRQQEPVETAQTGPIHLPLQHPHLVAKH